MKICVYPGSFDPVTNGHIDIIQRAARMFDKVIVAVVANPNKQPAFTLEDRAAFLKRVLSDMDNVEVDSFSGLLIDYMHVKKASVIIRGLRAVSDFEHEFQMALMNKKLDDNIETIFMMTSGQYSYLSSSMVKEVAGLGGCIKGLVPDEILPEVVRALRKKGE
ncbi:pantetheine-phosphate adenylyltransferase [Mahella australiensis]|uniref:Phosphopantetheine adenylyltransferase n=1 Tax=Mahella australiensis (strain DSM 15567 / CIP 107919 / 50-1 BON) TaxID=697281 RepID=F4A2L7_MAHA5|nr:pantetheine-phosphate adenylyltransferase [Mahella australiensis]AEE96197.1 Phosphopantetheine adenylyltransferase [Mahella australiensis 50-1 BON]MDK2903704.1 pantetheine-phosphate adenylyltransferase [Clostridiales bacterium]